MKRKILYKFSSLETRRQKEYVRGMITRRELYFSDPSAFNDPYDCNIGLHLRGSLKRFGVLCLSTEGCDMILMFSHYANRHKGLCLQFEIDEDETIGEVAPFNGRDVEYHDNIPSFNNSNQAHMTLLTKYMKWEYEREYRVLMSVNSHSDRIRTYKPGQLRGAIFGLHMTADDETSVRRWFRKGYHKDTFFKKAKLSKDGFALQYIDA
jgi:hypothetical protein